MCAADGSESAHAMRAVRQFAWLEADSVKMALSRPGRASGLPPAGTACV